MMTVRWMATVIGVVLVAALLAWALIAYPTDDPEVLRQEIESLKAGQQAIQKELGAIKQLLVQLRPPRRPPAIEPVDLKLSIAGDPVKGDPQAPLTMVEFSDYECPFCVRHFQTTWPQLAQEYLRTGKIRYVFRDFPLKAIHKNASKAAEAAHCAGEQGQYWAMHDRLFAHRTALSPDDLPRHAEAVGLALPEFQACVDSGRYAEKVRQGLTDGKAAGVRGTPTFFVGFTDGEATTITVTRRLRGARPFAEFQKAFASLLAEREAAK